MLALSDMARSAAAAASAGPGAASAGGAGEVDPAKLAGAYLTLQSGVTCLLDSSSASKVFSLFFIVYHCFFLLFF